MLTFLGPLPMRLGTVLNKLSCGCQCVSLRAL